ncbi:MAG: hydroxypyruvate isomerase [Proteobacteria bacterium]|nr:MAG: hydroxypyruvate isomerase [Pseudomonadota bacterium]
MPKFAANLTLLFNEAAFPDRFALAAKAGFKGVECLFPYPWPADTLRQRLGENHLEQVLFNLPAGDWDRGDRGIACDPTRKTEFSESVALAIEYARILGCSRLNCLAGIKPESVSDTTAFDTLVENVIHAATQLAPHGINLMIEAINTKVDIPGFFLSNSRRAMELIKTAACDNLYFQYDIYHMQIMEGDLLNTIKQLLPKIGHIQFADTPGRHEPGTGEINLPEIFRQLDTLDYSGWVSAEYRPATNTEASLNWFNPEA